MKRLRDAGRIRDALQYADRDTCPELRACVLVDLARVDFPRLHSEPGQKNAVIKKLEEAIELVQGYNLFGIYRN